MFEAILFPVLFLSVIGLVSGILLSLAGKFFSVEESQTVQNLRGALPGANCGACGYAGCQEYAVAVSEGAAANLCIPGGKSVAASLADIMGTNAGDVEELKAAVSCCGTEGLSENLMDYQGPQTCEACNLYYRGKKECSFACLGFGDCVTVCQYDAIQVEDGVAIVNPEKCTGCKACEKKCPKEIIHMIPKKGKVFVACSSTDKGGVTRSKCKAGCIGCKKCEKTCRFDAIHVTDNLAFVDQSKCTGCGECVPVCPTKCIRFS